VLFELLACVQSAIEKLWLQGDAELLCWHAKGQQPLKEPELLPPEEGHWQQDAEP
jgi:hypothetical protein